MLSIRTQSLKAKDQKGGVILMSDEDFTARSILKNNEEEQFIKVKKSIQQSYHDHKSVCMQ